MTSEDGCLAAFKKMMVKRNCELELEAVKAIKAMHVRVQRMRVRDMECVSCALRVCARFFCTFVLRCVCTLACVRVCVCVCVVCVDMCVLVCLCVCVRVCVSASPSAFCAAAHRSWPALVRASGANTDRRRRRCRRRRRGRGDGGGVWGPLSIRARQHL